MAKVKRKTVNPAELKPHPMNYQHHGEMETRHLIESIKTHGQYKAVVVSRDGVVLAGHGVVKALTAMGRKTVNVAVVPYDHTDTRALKLLTGDNEIGRLADRDDLMLIDVLKTLDSESALLGTGFDDGMLAGLVAITAPPDVMYGDEGVEGESGTGGGGDPPEKSRGPQENNGAGEGAGNQDENDWDITPYEEEEIQWRVTVSFKDKETRDKFVIDRQLGEPVGQTKDILMFRFPNEGKLDFISLKFEGEDAKKKEA